MTKIFRYLNAEYNGNWIRGIYYCLNIVAEQYNDIFSYLRNMAFKLESEDLNYGEIAITHSDLSGIGVVAGVFTPFISAESNAGSIVFTNSHIVNGEEYSERGLMNRDTERFDFIRTDQTEYLTDITTEASHTRQASFIPEGAPILGYIAEGTTVLDTEGNIILSAILSTPPSGVAYYPYYGEQYLFLSEIFLRSIYIDIDTYKKMFEVMQSIRYNGASISGIAELTSAITEDYIHDVYFTTLGYVITLHYSLFEESGVTMKVKRLAVWRLIMGMKYKQITLVEEI